MDFKNLVKYIKDVGCRVRLYDKKNMGDSIGTFHVAECGPIICLATKNMPKKKRVEYLLHEFAHFLQWKDGFMETIDNIFDTYELWDDWVEGKIELTKRERLAGRNAMLAIEWDAEYRAYELGNSLKAEHFDADYHLKGANAYILAIKWGWYHRKNFSTCPKRKKIEGRVLTKKQLFAKLTRKEKKLLEKFSGS